MPHVWPEDTDFALWELDVLDRDCPACGRMMHICDHRYRHFYTLDGPVELVCKLNHCPDPRCSGHARTKSPEVEPTIALPGWGIAWDVFCWIGHRRFSRHWSIPQIRAELHDAFAIDLTEPGIANYIRRYQAMLAARQQDPEALRRHYQGTETLILSIDGLQPEKGHETLYVVRELTGKRVWFAETLLSATATEVQRLIAKAKQWADALSKRRTPSSRGSPRSSRGSRTATVPTISSATWPSRCWRPTAMPRCRCVRRSAVSGGSSARC